MYQRFWHKSTKTQKTSNCFLETLLSFIGCSPHLTSTKDILLGIAFNRKSCFFKTNINFNGHSSLQLALPHQSQEPRKPMASVILSSGPFRSFKAEVLSKDTRSEMDMALQLPISWSPRIGFFPGSQPHKNLLLTKKDMVVDSIFKEKSRIILESLTWSDDMSFFSQFCVSLPKMS